MRCPRTYRPYVEGIRDETEALGQVVTNFLNFARPAQLSLVTGRSARARERAADEMRADARRGRRRRRCAASSAPSRATRSCCGRRSATCCATRSRRAPTHRVAPGPGRVGRRRRSTDRGSSSTITARARPPAGASSVRSSRRSARAPASAWRWCRRSSCCTTAALPSALRRWAAPACRSRCRSTPSLTRGASSLGLPDTLSRAPLCRRAPFSWLARALARRRKRSACFER